MRTIMIIIYDGSLPSNIGGGSNVRNILRRVFSILRINDWWSKIGEMEGFLELFNVVKLDIEDLYGPMKEYKSFEEIIKKEYN